MVEKPSKPLISLPYSIKGEFFEDIIFFVGLSAFILARISLTFFLLSLMAQAILVLLPRPHKINLIQTLRQAVDELLYPSCAKSISIISYYRIPNVAA